MIASLRTVPSWLVLAALCTLAACGSEGGERGELVADPVLRIASGSDAELRFGVVSDLAVAGDGTLFSVHPTDYRVRIWTPEGEGIGAIGGFGSDPGLFRRPEVAGFRGDSLWVFDPVLNRAAWYEADGTFLGTETARPDLAGDGRMPARPVHPSVDGSWIGAPVVPQRLVVAGAVDSGAWVRLGPGGELLDTIYVASLGPEGVLAIEHDEGATSTSQPFGDDALISIDPAGDGLVVVERRVGEGAPGRVWVGRLDAAGDTVWSREMRFETVPVTDARADSAAAALAGRLQGMIGDRTGLTEEELRQTVLERLYRPAHLPAVGSALVGRDGTIWLGLVDGGAEGSSAPGVEGGDAGVGDGSRTEPSSRTGRRWRILDPDGSDLATVVLPADFQPLEADRSGVWGTRSGEEEIPPIIGYALRGR